MKIDNDYFVEEKDKASDSNESASNSRLCSIYDSEFWSLVKIAAELFTSMMNTFSAFCMINTKKKRSTMSDPKQVEEDNMCNTGSGVLRRLYVEQAKYKMYRMPVFRPPPIFVVYLKHLDHKLKHDLKNLDKKSRDIVMRVAIERIFELGHKGFFLDSIKDGDLLHWRFE